MSPLMDCTTFARMYHDVKVLDFVSSTSDLTTYTFTAVNLGDLGSVMSTSGDAYGTNPHVRSAGRKMVAVIVHGEDANATFGVNSVTIGGVSGTEQIDRGGLSNAINTAIYAWDTASLQGITTTDVVVTWSEAVTGCAIGVVLVSNIGLFALGSTPVAGGTGTGTVVAGTGATGVDRDRPLLYLMGSTCAVGTEVVQGFVGTLATNPNSAINPVLLYEGSNAEFAFAAAYAVSFCGAQPSTSESFNVSWSGTGDKDHQVALFR
jgi:hypothetical protein